MNNMKSYLCAALCATMLTATAGATANPNPWTGSAAGPEGTYNSPLGTYNSDAPAAPLAYTWGQLTWNKDGSFLLENQMKDETLLLREMGTLYLDAVTGLPLDKETIADGDTVYAYVNLAQSTAAVVLANIPMDFAVPQYVQIGASTITAEKAELVGLNEDTLTITADAEIVPYLTRNIVTLTDLTPGTNVLVWRDMENTVNRVMVFPAANRGVVAVNADGSVTLDGVALAVDAKIVGETTLLPIRALGEAMGYDVSWVTGEGAVVAQGSDVVFSMLPNGTTCVLEDGVSYADAATYAQALELTLQA